MTEVIKAGKGNRHIGSGYKRLLAGILYVLSLIGLVSCGSNEVRRVCGIDPSASARAEDFGTYISINGEQLNFPITVQDLLDRGFDVVCYQGTLDPGSYDIAGIEGYQDIEYGGVIEGRVTIYNETDQVVPYEEGTIGAFRITLEAIRKYGIAIEIGGITLGAEGSITPEEVIQTFGEDAVYDGFRYCDIDGISEDGQKTGYSMTLETDTGDEITGISLFVPLFSEDYEVNQLY